jgi:hypothetical protein
VQDENGNGRQKQQESGGRRWGGYLYGLVGFGVSDNIGDGGGGLLFWTAEVWFDFFGSERRILVVPDESEGGITHRPERFFIVQRGVLRS